MRLLWLTWKDTKHPLAGGAEVVNEELAKRLARDGHEVRFIVGGFKDGAAHERRDGFEITRLGNRYTLYYHAWRHYRKYLKGWPDLVIEEVNTMPFFSRLYTHRPRLLFFHQLSRQIWFYQMPLPFSLIGYLAEPLYLRFLRGDPVVTVSESTKQDLIRHGFKREDIQIISEGITILPVKNLSAIHKYERPTLLAFGALRAMKRTLDIVKVFELAKQSIPELQLKIAGDASDAYGRKVLRAIQQSRYAAGISYMGPASPAEKLKLMQKSHLLVVTSAKEGWGLVVTEAASQGTPAVVYNTDGLRDSVQNGVTGSVVSNRNPRAIADKIVQVLNNYELYETLRQNARRISREFTFDNSYKSFMEVLANEESVDFSNRTYQEQRRVFKSLP